MIQIIFDIILIILFTMCSILMLMEGSIFVAALYIICVICRIICLIVHIKDEIE